MLNAFRRPLIVLTLGATALATGACGRISILPPEPPPPIGSVYQPMPTELQAAVAVARKALADPEPQLLYAAAYGVQPNGKFADSHRSGWVVGFQEQRASGPRASLVVIDWRAMARVIAAKPPATPVPALDAAKLPPIRQALTWARDAGMKKADTFQLAYVAGPDGARVAIGERGDDDRITPLDTEADERQVIVFDAATGQAIAKPAPAPAAGTVEEGSPEPDSPEGAATLAALALGPTRGF
jgi:hypothetical protein